MPYTPTTVINYDRRLAIPQDVLDNVLTPLKDTHSVFNHVALGVPFSEDVALRDVVLKHHFPAAFVDEVPVNVLNGYESSLGPGWVAHTSREELTDLHTGIWIVDRLDRDDLIVQKIQDLFLPVLDMMYADKRRDGNAKTTQLMVCRDSKRELGDRWICFADFHTHFGFTS